MGYGGAGGLLRMVSVTLFASVWPILFQAMQVEGDGSPFVSRRLGMPSLIEPESGRTIFVFVSCTLLSRLPTTPGRDGR
jgi:hypothetical protein